MNKRNTYQTDFLTADSFLIGVGSVINLAGYYFKYNYSDSSDRADAIAIANDWKMVGQDIQNSISGFEKENKIQKQLVLPF